MSSTGNNPQQGVNRQLCNEGYRFRFFQAVRLLQMGDAETFPIGHDAAPSNEAVRFRAFPSVEFPASEIQEVTSNDLEHPPEMIVNFFGLFGPMGALPQHYTEMIIERLMRKDRTLLEFLDLFNHRLISLFYRAWEKYQFWIVGERALLEDQRHLATDLQKHRAYVLDVRPRLDPIGQILLSLTGLGSSSTRFVLPNRERLEPRTEISDQTWRFYAGLFSHRQRPAINLERILSDHFELNVRVFALCGRWLQLEDEDRTTLRLGGNTRLGIETIAGRKVWEAQGKFRLRIGPLSYQQFCSLLPIGGSHRAVTDLTRYYVGFQMDFDFELQILTNEIPKCLCGDSNGIGARLGWNTWLRSRSFTERTASTFLRPLESN